MREGKLVNCYLAATTQTRLPQRYSAFREATTLYKITSGTNVSFLEGLCAGHAEDVRSHTGATGRLSSSSSRLCL
jgi:hypothetical protein